MCTRLANLLCGLSFDMDPAASMERWVGKVALVTGASCGIGAAITRALIRCGMIVVGCARNVDRIKAS